MLELDKLRAQLTSDQRAIINAIWRYDREKNKVYPLSHFTINSVLKRQYALP
jgi:hypothetical protein